MADIYTPKIKVDENGSVQDLNLNAYAIQSKVPSVETTANTIVVRDNSGRTKISGNIDSPIQLMDVDLNTYNTIEKCGYYWCSSGSNVSNRPVANIACSFHIFRSATGDFHQVCYTDINADARIYFRKYIAGKNWTEWILVATQKFVDDNYVSLAGGDTINGDLKVKGMVYANYFRELDTSKHYINLITGDNKDFGITGKNSTVYDLEEFYSKTETDDKFALKEDITGKINVSIDCDHEYEITGKTGHEYAVAVPDGQVLVKRINGQTRRKSLNLTKSFTWNSGSSTPTDQYVNSYQFDNSELILGKQYTINFKTKNTGAKLYVSDETFSGGTFSQPFTCDGKEHTLVFTYATNGNKLFKNYIDNTGLLDATTIYDVQILEGDYTNKEIPLYQEYNNTLVNSKCNLKSSGRNLIDINKLIEGRNAKGLTSTYKDGYTYTTTINSDTRVWGYSSAELYMTLPAGTYKIVGQWGSSATGNAVRIYDSSNNQLIKLNGNSTSIASDSFTLSQLTEVGIITKSYNTSLSLSLYYGTDHDNSFEPYEESSMLVDKELGEFDYIDNVGHLLIKQTSEVITLDGSDDEGWSVASFTAQGNSIFIRNLPDVDQTNINIPLVCNNVPVISAGEGDTGNSVGLNISYVLRYYGTGLSDLNSFKTFLSQNPIKIVYKKQTLTTETIQLEAGYQVWNSGLQIQETETIPYVLEKEYAVSLYSQVLAITSIVNSMPDDVATKTWTDANYISNIQKGQADGVVPLNSEGKIDSTYLPPSEYVQKYAHHLTFKRIVEEDNQILVYITFTIVNTQKDKYKPVIGLPQISQTLNNQGFNSQERVSLAQGVWREGNTNNYLSVFGVYGTLVAGTWKVNCVGITKNTADVTVYSLVGLDFASDVVVPL